MLLLSVLIYIALILTRVYKLKVENVVVINLGFAIHMLLCAMRRWMFTAHTTRSSASASSGSAAPIVYDMFTSIPGG